MRPLFVCLALVLTLASPMPAESATPEPARPAPVDSGALRREAAQIATIRALLADPDPTVRLLAVRDYARSPNPIQSQLAIEAGLSSTELAMQEVALRAVLATTKQIVIALEGGGCMRGSGVRSSLDLPITSFDPATANIAGKGWSGQLQGATFAFASGARSGTLLFDPESREFRGTVNLAGGRAGCAQNASWRPR